MRKLGGLAAAILILGLAGSLQAGDFNGDGISDLAVGAPNEDYNSVSNAGAINMLLGSTGGITVDGDAFYAQDVAGIVGTAATNDYFGRALAIGDFDGDGYDDLAVGVPDKDVDGAAGAGQVHIIPGDSSGLTFVGDYSLTQEDVTGFTTSEAGDRWGHALASGDFNADGYDDLAVGAPTETVGSTSDAGLVIVVYGSASGLTSSGSEHWEQDDIEAGGTEPNDLFGASLAVGDFDGDGYDDLAIGSTGETFGAGTESAGLVAVVWGDPTGLVTSPALDFWHQERMTFAGVNEAYDHYGFALAAGDFDNDGYDDLAVGIPDEDLDAYTDCGWLHVIRGSAAGLTNVGGQQIHQEYVPGTDRESNDRFGFSLATGDFDGDGFDDLAVGSPYENWSGADQAGVAHVIPGSALGLDTSGSSMIGEANLDIGSVVAEDRFAFRLASGDFDGDGYGDLVLTSPWEDFVLTDMGWIFLVYGSSLGLDLDNEYFNHCFTGVQGDCEDGDLFGWSVAASRVTKTLFAGDFEPGDTDRWSAATE